MDKLLLALLLAVVCMMLFAAQLDQELAMHSLFQTKHALNRAAHAAAQQMDVEKLALGVKSIDDSKAETTALTYLQQNLALDASLIEMTRFEVINELSDFPLNIIFANHEEVHVVKRPAVVIQLQASYPRSFSLLPPIEWEIRAIAELRDPYGIMK